VTETPFRNRLARMVEKEDLMMKRGSVMMEIPSECGTLWVESGRRKPGGTGCSFLAAAAAGPVICAICG
jgi:hypothetical protein